MNSNFYLVVPPGLESLALLELQEKFPGLAAEAGVGGIELEAPFDIGLALHFYLKIPTEIRLRIEHFRCRDLPKLFQKTSNIRWGKYLLGQDFTLSVASSQSRLLNEKKIAASVSEGILRHFKKQPPKKPKTPGSHEIHVRFYDDDCAISLDLAGDPLFQRGYKSMKAVAPIRENIAAALYWALWKTAGPFEALLDPMCGSGTLLLEAERFWQKQRRDFLFQKHSDWLVADIVLSVSGPKQFYGFDQSEIPLAALHETIGDAKAAGAPNWQLAKRDVFADKPFPITENLAIICNPPYGERLKLPAPPKVYYKKLMDALLSYQPKAIGLILPKKFTGFVPEKCGGYSLQKTFAFKNGGLPVVYGIWSV